MRFDRQASTIDCSTESCPASQHRGAWRAASIIGGLALALSSLPAHAAAPSEPPAEPVASPASDSSARPDVLRVEVDPAIDDATLLPAWIAERHPRLAEELRTPEHARAQWIAVRIAGSTYDYRVSVTAMRDGEPLGPRAEPTRCECTIEELLEQVDQGIATASEQLREAVPSEPAPQPEPVEATPASSPAAEPPEPGVVRPTLDARSRRLGPLGGAGIGASVAGAGLTTAGILLAMRPKEIRGAPGQVEVRDFRASGTALAVSGGVVLATGVALLMGDLVGPRRRVTAFVPVLRPGMAVASIVRRF